MLGSIQATLSVQGDSSVSRKTPSTVLPIAITSLGKRISTSVWIASEVWLITVWIFKLFRSSMLLEVVLILSLGLSCWRDHLLIMAKGQDQIHSLLLSSRQPLSAVDLDYLKIAGEVWFGPFIFILYARMLIMLPHTRIHHLCDHPSHWPPFPCPLPTSHTTTSMHTSTTIKPILSLHSPTHMHGDHARVSYIFHTHFPTPPVNLFLS